MGAALLAGILSVLVFGMANAFLGSIKLKLAPRIQVDNAQFGKIVAVFEWTRVFVGILGGVALDSFGHRPVFISGVILTALAVFMTGGAGTVGSVMIACVILGIGTQVLGLGGTTLIASSLANPSAGSNLGLAMMSLGMIGTPITTAYLFRRLEFRGALRAIAAIVMVPVVFTIIGKFPVLNTSSTLNFGAAFALLGNYIVWLSALTLFCYVGTSVSMSVWITTYASELGADNIQASKTLSLFFVSMMSSRFVFAFQDKATGIDLTPIGGYIVAGLALILTIAVRMMMRAGSLRAARGAVVLAGLVEGPIFPTVVGVTFQHFPASQWGGVAGHYLCRRHHRFQYLATPHW
ncbi:MFS transporter [Acidobacteria bacterium AH-259-D05]|nr:MFS transporter [Acidobacteria bacterium AH-259-D05]